MKRILTALLALGLIGGSVATAEAKNPETVLSGRIVAGSVYLHGQHDCHAAPQCRGWLSAGCPALTGHDPAVNASIEDVAHLADGVTTWRFEARSGYGYFGQRVWIVVQLWRRDCTEIRAARWCRSQDCDPHSDGPWRSPFLRLPKSAKFMTVVGDPYLPWPGQLVTEPVEEPVIKWALTGPRR